MGTIAILILRSAADMLRQKMNGPIVMQLLVIVI